MDDSTPNQAPVDLREAIARRTRETQLKLLDGIERDLAEGRLPSPHLAEYEVLCRAEQMSRGG